MELKHRRSDVRSADMQQSSERWCRVMADAHRRSEGVAQWYSRRASDGRRKAEEIARKCIEGPGQRETRSSGGPMVRTETKDNSQRPLALLDSELRPVNRQEARSSEEIAGKGD